MHSWNALKPPQDRSSLPRLITFCVSGALSDSDAELSLKSAIVIVARRSLPLQSPSFAKGTSCQVFPGSLAANFYQDFESKGLRSKIAISKTGDQRPMLGIGARSRLFKHVLVQVAKERAQRKRKGKHIRSARPFPQQILEREVTKLQTVGNLDESIF
jgi:hypothetical protein